MIARELAARWIVVAGFGAGALAAVLVAALDGPHETGIAALTPLRPATAAAASPSAGESDTQIRGIEPLQPCLRTRRVSIPSGGKNSMSPARRYAVMGAVVAIAAMFAAAFIIYSARDGDAVGADATTSATPGAPMVEITATDFAFQGPSQLEAGPAAITFVNAGQEEHHAIFLRLNDGVSAEQLTAALPEGPAAVLRLTTIHGGAQTAPPGTSQHATLDLSAGHYVFLCFVQGEDGVPHAAKGMMHALDVTAGAAQASSPKADVAVSLQDFSFGMSVPPTAGPQTWEIINRGPQPHELALYTLAPGKTFDDVAAYVQNPNGPRPVTRVSGVELLTEGERAWIDLDLAAGGYVLVCTIPDPASGKEHVDLGMLATFTVASP